MTTTGENPNRVDWDKSLIITLMPEWTDTLAEDMTRICYREAIKNGYYHDAKTGEPIRYTVRELISFVMSELNEAWDADIDGAMDKHLPHRLGAEVEIADALIILFGACGHLGLDIGKAMAEKLEYNRTREDHRKGGTAMSTHDRAYEGEIGDSFRVGEIWKSPRGTIYKVTDVYDPIGISRRRAVLRKRSHSDNKIGRKIERDWDDVIGWVRISDDNAAVR